MTGSCSVRVPAALVIESEAHAGRGAPVYAEVAGAGITADAHDIAQPDPEGLGATRAMQTALREAGLSPRTSGTSTRMPRRRRRATSPRPGDHDALGGEIDHVVVTRPSR